MCEDCACEYCENFHVAIVVVIPVPEKLVDVQFVQAVVYA